MEQQQTPTNRNARPRHTPTPKMSQRKKALFGNKPFGHLPSTIDEDSDLGPMSPLQFSSSPTHYDSETSSKATGRFMRTRDIRTDFKNIIMQSLTPTHDNRRANSVTPTKVAELRRQTPTPPRHPNESLFNSPDKENLQEVALKTPRETTAVHVPRVSFRKSLIFDSGLTPDDTHLSPNTRKCLLKRNSFPMPDNNTSGDETLTKQLSFNENPKAKTSLTFKDAFVISPKRFYGTSGACQPMPSKRTANDPPRELHRPSQRPSAARSSSAKRRRPTKSQPNLRPVLGSIRKGVRQKIAKPKVQTKIGKVDLKVMNKMHIIEAALNIINSNKVASTKGAGTDDKITREQIDRIQKILKNQRNSYELSSKPLNWNGEKSDASTADTSHEDVENEATPSVENDATPVVAKKFFKSKPSGDAKTYSVVNGLRATVKRGASIKLLSPKRKKQRNKQDDYDEYLAIQAEVADIIGMLDQVPDDGPASVGNADVLTPPIASATAPLTIDHHELDAANNYEKFRQLLPYNTNDPETLRRQENLLELLYSNDLCTPENFTIFIAEPDLHKDEAARILDQLIVVDAADQAMYGDDLHVTDFATDDCPMSPASQISTMTLGLALGSPTCPDKHRADASAEHGVDKFYPIFNRAATCIMTATVGSTATSAAFAADTAAKQTSCTLRKWKGMGRSQYQIDAGQKKFGGITCKECGMFYGAHEPEEELLHQRYHSARSHLSFKGWQDERMVQQMPEWGLDGRILCVSGRDRKSWLNRMKQILEVVDEDLGFDGVPLPERNIVYLAIAKQQVIGVCVVEPQKKAHRLINQNGMAYVDTTCTVDVKCGISRIWVVQSFRRCGIASKLIEGIRSHFIRGYNIYADELAFSSLTDVGRIFAERITNGHVFVYEQTHEQRQSVDDHLV